MKSESCRLIWFIKWLPRGHPFRDVHDVYWSSTSSLYEPDWAWALYLDKGRPV